MSTVHLQILKNLNKKPTVGKVILCIFLSFVLIVALFGTTEEDSNTGVTEQDYTELTETIDPYQEIKDEIYSVTDNSELTDNIVLAFGDINANLNLISDFTKTSDWAGGERYTCKYTKNSVSTPLTVYCNMDNTINSINTTLASPYEQGYEPVDISNFAPSYSMYSEYTTKTTLYMENFVLYPSTMEIEETYGMSRYYDLYYFSNTLSCENALGIRTDYPFVIAYCDDGTTTSVAYINFDGDILIDNRDDYEVEKIATETGSTYEDISIIYGQLGNYGEYVVVDGYTYIEFFVPIGKYEIFNNGKIASIYIVSDELYKSSDGWLDNIIYETIKFTEYEQTQEVEILEGQHIQVATATSIILTKLDE